MIRTVVSHRIDFSVLEEEKCAEVESVLAQEASLLLCKQYRVVEAEGITIQRLLFRIRELDFSLSTLYLLREGASSSQQHAIRKADLQKAAAVGMEEAFDLHAAELLDNLANLLQVLELALLRVDVHSRVLRDNIREPEIRYISPPVGH
jgi:hypothetical protein